LAEAFERCGWRIALSRTTPRQAAPVCDIARLRGLGVEPVPVLQALEARLRQEDFVEAG
jgi:hypothetical protein